MMESGGAARLNAGAWFFDILKLVRGQSLVVSCGTLAWRCCLELVRAIASSCELVECGIEMAG